MIIHIEYPHPSYQGLALCNTGLRLQRVESPETSLYYASASEDHICKKCIQALSWPGFQEMDRYRIRTFGIIQKPEKIKRVIPKTEKFEKMIPENGSFFDAHKDCYLKEARAMFEYKNWKGKNRCVKLAGDD
jgi:hypothetical protein